MSEHADDDAVAWLALIGRFEVVHDRLEVCGQQRRPGGGAHPVEVFRLTDQLEVTVPVARSVNAVTGTNWEQVGVVPDLECDSEAALDLARRSLS